jgi:hypothetical protein
MVMAWISVHESIMGTKLRSLSKRLGCSQNEALGILIRLWLWCIKSADRYGEIKDVIREDVEDVLTIGKSNDLDQEDIVQALIDNDWIRFEGDVLFIQDWEEWQKQWYLAEDMREYNNRRQREYRKRQREKERENKEPDTDKKGKKSKSMDPQHPESEEKADEVPEEEKKSVPQVKNREYSEKFEEFWKIYPRKIGKAEAYKKYCTRLKDGFSEDELLAAAKEYARRCTLEHTDQTYIKHAKTFLSDNTPFIDYLPKQGRSSPDEDDTGSGGFLPSS